MTATLIGSGAPRLQRNWDSRAALNFIGGGSGTGLLLAASAALPAGWPYYPFGIMAITLIGLGLSMVWWEIGRPLRALNVFFHPQTSWMTREAFLALPVLTLAGLAVLLDQPFVPVPFQAHAPAAILARVAAVLGLGFLYCQARILHASRGVPAWRERSLQPVIIITGIAEGSGLMLLLGLFFGRPSTLAVVASIVVLVMRAAAWERYRYQLKLAAPGPANVAIGRASLPIHLLGHVVAAILLLAALVGLSPALSAAVAGLFVAATGAWLKFAVVTRAAFTQGFSVPFVPIRGSIGAPMRHR